MLQYEKSCRNGREAGWTAIFCRHGNRAYSVNQRQAVMVKGWQGIELDGQEGANGGGLLLPLIGICGSIPLLDTLRDAFL